MLSNNSHTLSFFVCLHCATYCYAWRCACAHASLKRKRGTRASTAWYHRDVASGVARRRGSGAARTRRGGAAGVDRKSRIQSIMGEYVSLVARAKARGAARGNARARAGTRAHCTLHCLSTPHCLACLRHLYATRCAGGNAPLRCLSCRCSDITRGRRLSRATHTRRR